MEKRERKHVSLAACLLGTLVLLWPVCALAQQGAAGDGGAAAVGGADDLDKLLDMDVSQLSKVSVVAPALQTEVTTVSRQESTIGRSPAAVFVITNEMIRRSGAKTIPDLLRMVPGVNVARIDANKWAVSIRGSNGRFANKLLVQIDGRSVYTPLFGGVYWDVQDVVFEEGRSDRVEIRGFEICEVQATDFGSETARETLYVERHGRSLRLKFWFGQPQRGKRG